MLDKDDITKSYGKISKKELLKELDFKEYQLVSFLNNQGVFREKYILVEDDEKDGILIGEVTGKKARKYYDDFSGLTVAVLGLTFKPGTDDLREAPSLVNIPIMLEDGAKVKAWDPVGVENYRKHFPNEIEYCDTIERVLEDADICFIFTEWPEVKELDVMKYKAFMRHPIVLDGRNCYKLERFEGTGITYDSIGRETIWN